MQELDRFDGVVIVTTNLFENYDPALLRRIARHIKFRLPNTSMRRELFALHLPNPERVEALHGSCGAIKGTQRRGHSEHLRKCYQCGQHGRGLGEVKGDAGGN